MTPRCKIYCPINAYSVVVVGAGGGGGLPFMGTINNSSSTTSQTESEGESFAVGCHLYVGWDRDRGQGIAPDGKKVKIPSRKLTLPERDFCPVSNSRS